MYNWRRKKTITILGSCCSRDILEYLPSDTYDISLYIARTKIVSQLSSPAVVDKELSLSSSFQKRLVMNDLLKYQWESLNEKHGTFCIIDFIDERFNLLKIGIGGGNSSVQTTFITKSNELISSGYLEGKRYTEMQYNYEDSQWKIDGQNINTYLETWLQHILRYYRPQKIILHKAYLVNTFFNKNGELESFSKPYLINNEKVNLLLHYLYDYTEQYLNKTFFSKIKTIDLCDKYHADQSHKWGLAPMHYQENYYVEAADLIKRYMKL